MGNRVEVKTTRFDELNVFELSRWEWQFATANPRVGRSYHTALALLIFIVYYNMINVGQSWISSSRVSFWGFLLTLHGSVLMLALFWLTARHFNLSWRHLIMRPLAKGNDAS